MLLQWLSLGKDAGMLRNDIKDIVHQCTSMMGLSDPGLTTSSAAQFDREA